MRSERGGSVGAIEQVWRCEAPRVLAALVHRYGDFDICEDAAQEAWLAAARQWPVEGVPDDPGAWLIRVGSRKFIDRRRSEAARTARETTEFLLRPDGAGIAPEAEAGGNRVASDDTLLLLTLCCHPILASASQVALTLRAVGGLSTEQIAAAFLVPTATMGQRISRAKALLRKHDVRFEPPPPDNLPERSRSVLQVLYLIFNEGYIRSGGRELLDTSLTTEALRLTRQLHTVLPGDDEVTGALALMLLTQARADTRTDAQGDLVPLERQVRDRWDREEIAEAVGLLERVLADGPVGPFQLQAAIAAVHAEAPTWSDTDWTQIEVLYRMLQVRAPSPTVDLNLAVAVGMAQGPEAGLAALAHLDELPVMRRHHRLPAVRAHLLERAGRWQEAQQDYRRAAQLTASIPEQRYLNARAEGVERAG